MELLMFVLTQMFIRIPSASLLAVDSRLGDVADFSTIVIRINAVEPWTNIS
jgi:hypothetical protein